MNALTFLYVHTDEGFIGYGRMGSEMARELRARGYTVWDDDGNPDTPFGQVKPETSGHTRSPSPTNLVCWASVPSHMTGHFEGQHVGFVSMWEAMTLPESFRDNFHEVDTFIVPSLHNVELFSKYHPNVHFMPLGINPTLWHPIPPTPPEREFRFLINGRGERKGVDLAFRAFREVFHGKDLSPQPVLIMKSLRGHGKYYADDITHVTGRISAQEEVDLYASCHAYLQPSRGEGFGLAPLQAMALGRPTILTNAHGHESFAHLGIGLDWAPSKADYFIYGDAGEWWEPDYDQLCEAMWDVYQNWSSHALHAGRNAEIIARDWTWAQTTDRFLEILGDEIAKPYTGSGVWHQAERKLYGIVTVRDFYTEIAGRALRFEKGETYYESADVKRILFDAGILDPVCLGDDHGLAEQQVEQLGLYRAQNSVCPTCHQTLNTQPTRSDEIYAELLAR